MLFMLTWHFMCSLEKELIKKFNVFQAREDYFSLLVMKRQFARFLGVNQTVLNDTEYENNNPT